MSDRTRLSLSVLVLLALALALTGGGASPFAKATAATYVYEKDDTAVPSAVLAAIDKLNRERKIIATIFEKDTVDGTGETPEQYKVALAAAKAAGLPSFVSQAGAKVLKVVKDPKTEEQVLEAVP